MMMKFKTLQSVVLVFVLLLSSYVSADQVLISAGGGKQPGASQDNRVVGIDYSFISKQRSARSTFSWGVSYSRLENNSTSHKGPVEVFSVYPQLTLYPVNDSFQQMFFFVRALGPSYISDNQFGERKQSRHFTFQAQMGVGYEINLNAQKKLLLQVSWKHFSNANLFSDNDGIDLPFVFSIGMNY